MNPRQWPEDHPFVKFAWTLARLGLWHWVGLSQNKKGPLDYETDKIGSPTPYKWLKEER